MIEWLLEAERALTAGDLADAERRYRKAIDTDGRNAIAVVGLARVAIARGDPQVASVHIARALAIDPENAAARRHAAELGAESVGVPVSPATPGTEVIIDPVETSADRRRSFLDLLLGRS